MVGSDKVDAPLEQSLPQSISVTALADRGRALECRRSVADVLSGKRQVVRARFDRDRQTCRSRLVQNRQRVA